EVIRKVQEERPDLPGVDPALARTLERAGSLKDAESTLVRAMGKAPSSEVLEALAGFYTRQKRIGDAIALLNGAVARNPGDDSMVFALATLYEKKGEWQKAVDKLKPVVERHPDNAQALNFMGYTIATNGGDLDEAEKLVKRALDEKPESPAFLDSLGWIQFKKNKLDDAAESLEKAVEASPDEATLLEHLGEVSLKLGRKARAQECFSRALELILQSPDDAERPTQKADLERRLKQLSPN
ncbi:MAG: tetratricopeptide repeat protein, partial [Archangium sp.]|nr:tetratricopeptide repeat protein [Archangium sp.]